MSIPLIPVTINNKIYQVRANASILQVCEEASIDVPRFCYHEKLSVAGNCRMCLVEVEKSPKPVVSCAMPVSKNMVIYTDTPLVKKTREAVLEFLLINHPLDCPICDQGGECDLQDETLQYGSDRGRFFEFKRSVEDKECGPIVKTIMTRCIHCTRCVRFSAEIAGQEVLGSFNRGQETEIGTYIQSFIKTELSGNLVDLCPVGALTSKPYAFAARNWELQKVDSIDFFDGTCADIIVHTRKATSPQYQNNKLNYITNDEIMRILPRTNGLYQDNWISDKSRYAFDGLKKQRLRNISCVSKQNKLNWFIFWFN
jgi:NADH dehydrogenase/NADH:ubiquinone oxidoreductase subunit G